MLTYISPGLRSEHVPLEYIVYIELSLSNNLFIISEKNLVYFISSKSLLVTDLDFAILHFWSWLKIVLVSSLLDFIFL